MLGDTNAPTSHPTHAPTYNVLNYRTTALFKEFDTLNSRLTSVSSNIVFSNFYYKGTVPIGQCSPWGQYASTETRLAADDLYYSQLTMYSGKVDFASGIGQNLTLTCNNPAIIKQIISSLNGGLSYDGICNSVRFRVETCASGVSICANCRAICTNTWCAKAIQTLDITMEPCTDCVSRKGFYNVMSLSYDYLILYPVFNSPITVTKQRTSLQVGLNISTAGNIYCYAAPPTSPNITSTTTVKTLGALLVALSGGNVTLTINNLSPSTTYAVYCYTESFGGQKMSLARTQATRKVEQTLCCASVVFNSYARSMPALEIGSTNVGSLTPAVIQLDTVPLTNYTISIRVIQSLNNCNVSVNVLHPVAVARPSNFTVVSGSASTVKSFLLFGDAACYTVHARLYRGKVLSSNNYLSNTTVQVALTSSAVQAPKLASAQYANNGLGFIIAFDIATDQGITVINNPASFSCQKVFDFQGAPSSTCSWTSTTQVSVTFNGNSINTVKYPVVGDTIKVVNKKVRSAYCVTVLATTPSTTCLFANSDFSAVLQGPPIPIIPVVALSAASQIGSCDNLVMDATSSGNRGSRAWLAITWFVGFAHSNGTQNAYIANSFQIYLNQNEATVDRLVTVTKEKLMIGTYTITLQLTNIFNQTNRATVIVSVLTASNIPSVRINGPISMDLFRANPISLVASAFVTSCNGKGNNNTVTLTWNVFKDNIYLPQVVSESNDPKIFKLSAYALNASSDYVIQVLARSTSKATSTASVRVNMGINQVFALISGGSNQRQSALTSFLLDGSASYSLDYPFDANKLSYRWQCVDVTSKFYGNPCSGVVMQSVAKFSVDFSAYLTSLESHSLQFTLFVDSVDKITASASTVLELYPLTTSPFVTLQPSQNKYNYNSKITVNGAVNAGFTSLVQWAVTNVNSNTSLFLTPQVKQLLPGNRQLQQAIAPYLLTPGGVYTLRLTAFFINSSRNFSSFAEISLVMNTPPVGGQLSVSPSNGTALNTTFHVQTFSWVDSSEDLPITTTFDYYNNIFSPPQLLKQRSTVTFVDSVLGAGLVQYGYNVTITVTAFDNLGASSSVSNSNARVNPAVISSNALFATTTSLLSQATSTSGGKSDGAYLTQVVNAVNVYLNTVNCSKVSADFCTSLVREPCQDLPQTCGKCLSGFIGPLGENSKCVQDPSTGDSGGVDKLLGINSTCIVDKQCISNLCYNGRCLDPLKTCPDNCNGNGNCTFLDYSNQLIPKCYTTDPYCHPECQCSTGYFGSYCQLTQSDYLNYRKIRSELCNSLNRSLSTLDGSVDVLKGTAISVNNVFQDYTQADAQTVRTCTTVLTTIIDSYQVNTGDEEVAPHILDAFDNILKVSNLSAVVREEILANIGQLLTNMQASTIIGEERYEYVTNNVRIASSVIDTNNSVSNSYSSQLPASSYETTNANPQSIAVGYDAGITGASQGVGLNAFVLTNSIDKPASTSPLVGFNVNLQSRDNGNGKKQTYQSRRRLSEHEELSYNHNDFVRDVIQSRTSQSVALQTTSSLTANYSVAVTFSTLQSVDYYQTSPINETVLCVKTYQNHTIVKDCGRGVHVSLYCPGDVGLIYRYVCPIYTLTPFCVVFQDHAYSKEHNCQVKAFSSTNVTCQCDFNTLTAANAVAHRRLAAGNDVVQLTTISEVVVTPFTTEILYSNDILEDNNTDNVIMLNTIFYAILLAVGLAYFYYQDYCHRAPSNAGLVKGLRLPAIYTFLSKLLLFNKRNAMTYDDLLRKNVFYPIIKEDDAAAGGDVKEYDPLHIHSRDGAAGPVVYNSKSSQRHILSSNFLFNSILPIEFTHLSIFKVIINKFCTESDVCHALSHLINFHHADVHMKILQVNYNANIQNNILLYPQYVSHYVTFLLFGTRLINICFINTVMFKYYFADDGQCEALLDEDSCLLPKTVFGIHQQCTWTPSIQAACGFNIVPINNLYNMLIVICFIMLYIVIFEYVFKMILMNILVFKFKEKHNNVVNNMKAKLRTKKIIPIKKDSSAPAKPVKPAAAVAATSRKNVLAKVNAKAAAAGKPAVPPPAAVVSPKPAPVIPTPSSAINNNLAAVVTTPYHVTPSYELRTFYYSKPQANLRYYHAARATLLANKSDKFNIYMEALYLHFHYNHSVLDQHMQLGWLDHVQAALSRPNLLFLFNRDFEAQYVSFGNIDAISHIVHSAKESRHPQTVLRPQTRDGLPDPELMMVSHKLVINHHILCIMNYLQKLRAKTRSVRTQINYLDRDIDRDRYMLQLYLISTLSPWEQRIAEMYFFSNFQTLLGNSYLEIFTDFYHNVSFIYAVFLAVLGYLVFALVYIFTDGLTIGKKVTVNYIVLIYLAIGLHYLLMQPAQIYMRYVITPFLIKNKMLFQHFLFKEQQHGIVQRRHGVLATVGKSLCQHVNLSLRVARAQPDLCLSKILLNMHDMDFRYLQHFPVRHAALYRLAYMICYVLNGLVFLPTFWLLPAFLHPLGQQVMVTVYLLAAAFALVFIYLHISPAAALLITVVTLVLAIAPPACYFVYLLYQSHRSRSTSKVSPADDFDELDDWATAMDERKQKKGHAADPEREVPSPITAAVNYASKDSYMDSLEHAADHAASSHQLHSMEQQKVLIGGGRKGQVHHAVLSAPEESYLTAQRQEMFPGKSMASQQPLHDLSTIYITRSGRHKRRGRLPLGTYFHERDSLYARKIITYKSQYAFMLKKGGGSSKPKSFQGMVRGVLTTAKRRRELNRQNQEQNSESFAATVAMHDEHKDATDYWDHFDDDVPAPAAVKAPLPAERYLQTMQQIKANTFTDRSKLAKLSSSNYKIVPKPKVLANIYIPKAYRRIKQLHKQVKEERERTAAEEEFSLDFHEPEPDPAEQLAAAAAALPQVVTLQAEPPHTTEGVKLEELQPAAAPAAVTAADLRQVRGEGPAGALTLKRLQRLQDKARRLHAHHRDIQHQHIKHSSSAGANPEQVLEDMHSPVKDVHLPGPQHASEDDFDLADILRHAPAGAVPVQDVPAMTLTNNFMDLDPSVPMTKRLRDKHLKRQQTAHALQAQQPGAGGAGHGSELDDMDDHFDDFDFMA